MRAVVQRASLSSVRVEGETVGKIEKGLVVFLGVESGDDEKDCHYVADKVVGLRIFEDEKGKMNLSLKDIGGEILCISQFTLLGDCRKGRRPSFIKAASTENAARLYEYFCEILRVEGVVVATGTFQAYMQVEVFNEGPVTILLDSEKNF